MKTKSSPKRNLILIITLFFMPVWVNAQEVMQYFRPNSKLGVNQFETSKIDSVKFTGLKVKIGANSELSYQTLRDQNNGNVSLIQLTNAFQLPMANLNLDVQLADGVRANITTYLSSRRHEEVWMKGGYLQFDKLPFLHNPYIDNIMKNITIRVGQGDADYGDEHFRRSDGGNTIYNPFIENYIMDEFSAEIGAHVYYHNNSGLFLMTAVTNGELNPTVYAPTQVDAATNKINKYDPVFLGKIGFDKQLNNDFRLRISGSFYTLNSGSGNGLFDGDHTGSHYFGVMENQVLANTYTLTNENDYSPFSGRLDPGFSEEVHAFMGNVFLKYKGLELFGTVENVTGRTINEAKNRTVNQYACDVIYRFPQGKENFWVGMRYNTVTALLPGATTNITINRTAASLGWFLTNNLMMKTEYVNQEYLNYQAPDILAGGKFNGMVFEFSLGF